MSHRRNALQRRTLALLLLVVSAQGCSGWKYVPLSEAVPAGHVRVRTNQGVNTVLERVSLDGDSVLVGVPEGETEAVRIPLMEVMGVAIRGHSWSGTATLIWFGVAAASMGMVLIHYLGT